MDYLFAFGFIFVVLLMMGVAARTADSKDRP